MGVGIALAWFVQNGYRVSVPFGEGQAYDLIVDKTALLRVQVKCSQGRTVSLRTTGGNQSWNRVAKRIDKNEVELVFIVVPTAQYLFPADLLHGRNAISLPLDKYEQYRLR